jgi:hypothetical protein
VFNEIEHEEELYPPSDVEQAKHIQNEYNRSREALREHRIAARPYYAVSNRLEQEERKKLANHAAHEIISFNQLAPGEKVEDFLQRGPTAPIDPNLYEVEMIFNDLLRTVGTQEANLGGMSGGTATESSIAEQSRTVSQADNVDDLDELLTDVAKAFGQICLMELSKETVVEIVGPGAVWPDMPQSREEAAKDLLLEIKAGSSGRPNRAPTGGTVGTRPRGIDPRGGAVDHGDQRDDVQADGCAWIARQRPWWRAHRRSSERPERAGSAGWPERDSRSCGNSRSAARLPRSDAGVVGQFENRPR